MINDKPEQANSQTRVPIQRRMVDYINNKYDDTFIYKAPYGGGAGGSGMRIFVSSEKCPGKNIRVTFHVINGQEVFGDDYFYYIYAEKTRACIDGILNTCFNFTYRLFMDDPVSMETVDLPGNTEFDSFIRNCGLSFAVLAAPGNEPKDRTAFEKAINSAFEASGVHVVHAAIHFLPPDCKTYTSNDEIKTAKLGDITKESNICRLTISHPGRPDFKCEWRTAHA